MVQLRDVIQKRQKQQDKKQDIRGRYRAVLTDAEGNQTSDTPLIDVWANQTTRRVWHMPLGASQPSQVFCLNISNPYVGLPVECGYEESNNTIEVLRVDQLPAKVGGDPTGYDQNDPAAFEPGGVKMMWLYTKAITPLATWPTSTGLTININEGDYPYHGARKTFAGVTAYALTQNPNPGQHYFAGLYIDANNALQVVYGASVVTTTDPPPEPAWPDGAFLLSVVRINDTQDDIILASDTDSTNDVFDRRMLWSDEFSTVGWPYDNIYTVSQTNLNANYPTIAAAVAAVPTQSIILLDAGVWTESFTLATDEVAIVGLNRIETRITSAGADTVIITGDACALYNLAITNSNVDTHYALTIDGSNARIQDVNLFKTGAGTLGAGLFHKSGTGLILDNVQSSCTDATSNYGYYNITNIVSAKILGGSYEGATADIFSSVAGSSARLLLPPNLVNNIISHSGTITGRYTDATGNLRYITTTGRTLGAWLEDISTGLRTYYSTLAAAITASAAGDLIWLEAGTYTGAFTLNKDITLKGSAHGDTILTQGGAGVTTLTISTAGARVEDLTVIHSGAGNAVDVSAATATLERVIAQSTAAAGTFKTGFAVASATKCTLIDCEATVSGGSSTQRGLYVVSGVCEATGCRFSGSSYDVENAGTLTINDCVLVNGLTTGIFSWMPEAKIVKNLLYHSLTYDIWQEGTTFNDIADDTYVADLWNVLHNGQAPDISGQAGGSTDPFARYFRCTFDSAASQCGIVQFLTNADTVPLRGQVVSLSFDAWSSGGVGELRAAVLSWGSTADTLTSDVVGTWAINNPTLATNWTYANTPAADIVITTARDRYAVNNILIPTTANNIAVFIWTSAEEASTDLFNIARVQLERGPVATEFVARPDREEIRLIQGFYEKSYDMAVTPGTSSQTGSQLWQTRTAIAASTAGQLYPPDCWFKTTKIKTPVVTVYGTTGTSGAINNLSAATVRTGATVPSTGLGLQTFGVVNISNADADAIALDAILAFQWTADSRL